MPALLDPTLMMAAITLDDLEKIRIGAENRYRQMTRTEPDEDGIIRGYGLDDSHPGVLAQKAVAEGLKQLEHQATLQLQRAMRQHPLGAWVKATVGIGEKQGARLLASIGDPYWNTLHDRPRTVSELWAYCGLHVIPTGHVIHDAHMSCASGEQISAHARSDDQIRIGGVAARRRKGQRANWSTEAKTRAYLCAVSCMKNRNSPYRAVYDARRAHTAVTHPDWTDGHSHNDALRVTSKAILKDLWRAAAVIHGAHHQDIAA